MSQGVQVDRRVTHHQRSTHGPRDQRQQRPYTLASPASIPEQPVRAEAAGEPARGPARRDRRLVEQRRGRVGPDPIHPDQVVLPGQLCGGHPDQKLPAGQATITLFDRPDSPIQLGDQAQPGGQLIDRDQARQTGHRGVRCPDPYTPFGLLGFAFPWPYRFHQAGALH
jgi:hypothetical protein